MSDSGRDKPGSGFWAIMFAMFAAFFTVPGAIQSYRATAPTPFAVPAGEVAGANAKTRNAAGQLSIAATPAVDGPIYEYLGLEIAASKAAAAPAPPAVVVAAPAESAAHIRDELLDRGPVSGLIVTIADPVGSTLSHHFDARVDAIKAAVSTEGYSLNRFYFPWQAETQAAKGDVHQEPGLLLFRRRSKDNDAKTETLLVYLVAESPLSGIEERAFQTAVERLTYWTKFEPCFQSPPLNIIGPCYSGSDISLAHAIAQSTPDQFLVITGGATAIHRERFETLSGGKARMFSTRVPNQNLRDAAILYLREHRMTRSREPRIAWLSEAGTSFGAAVRRVENQNAEETTTQFSFPFHIRLMSSQLSRARTPSAFHIATPNQSLLEFGVPDGTKAKDIPPLFTPAQSSPAIEQELRHTLSIIRHGDFDVVCISASDVWDYVALCELISEVCPDKQVILIGASRVFTHAKHLRFMRGVMVVSTYVPDLTTQKWSFPSGSVEKRFRHSPDAEGTIGLYNALILALRNPEIENTCDDQSNYVVRIDDKARIPALISYGQPFETQASGRFQPGAYVSVIGASGFIPLSFQPLNSLGCDNVGKPSTQLPLMKVVLGPSNKIDPCQLLDYPSPSRVLLPVLIALSLLGLLAFWHSSRGHWKFAKVDQGRLRTVMDHFLLLLSPLPSLADVKPPTEEGPANWLGVRHGIGATWVALFSLILMVWLSVITAIPLKLHAASHACACTYVFGIPALTLVLGFLVRPSERWKLRLTMAVLLVLIAGLIHAMTDAASFGETHKIAMFGFCCSNALLWAWMWFSRWNGIRRILQSLTPISSMIHNLLLKLVVWGQWGILIAIAWLVGPLLFALATAPSQTEATEFGLWFARTLDVTGGGSLLLTLILLTHVIFVWAIAMFRRLHMRVRSRPVPPWGFDSTVTTDPNPVAAGASRLVETSLGIDQILMYGCRPIKTQAPVAFGVVFSGIILWLSNLANRMPCTYSTLAMTIYVWFIGGLALIFWAHTMCQMILLRVWMHKLLRQITWLPLLHVLPRLPEQIRLLVGRFMDVRMLRPSHLRVRVHYLSRLQATLSPTMDFSRWTTVCPSIHDVDELVRDFEQELAESPDWQPTVNDSDLLVASPMAKTYQHLNDWGHKIWQGLLVEWSYRSPQAVYPDQIGLTAATDSKPASPHSAAMQAWISNAEELVAIHFVGYWHSILNYFYGLIWSAMLMTLLFLFAILAYPMQPQRLLLGTVFAMLAAVTVFSVNSLFVIEGNRVHMQLRGKAGGTGFDLTTFMKLGTWLMPGTLVALSYAFPGAVDSLLSIVGPFLMSPK